MELFEAIVSRQSVREFTGEAASADELNAVLEAALHAPRTFINKGVHISVISDKALLAELDACGVKKFGKQLGVSSAIYGAPTLVLLSGKLATEQIEGWDVGAEVFNRNLYWSMGSLVQNMHLAAVSMGLGACPINTVVVGLFDDSKLARRAGVPDGFSPLCSIAIGKTAHEYKPREIDKTHFEIEFL